MNFERYNSLTSELKNKVLLCYSLICIMYRSTKYSLVVKKTV